VGSQWLRKQTGGKNGVVADVLIGYDSTGLPFSNGVPIGFTGDTAEDILSALQQIIKNDYDYDGISTLSTI
jgi:hypothetical protein